MPLTDTTLVFIATLAAATSGGVLLGDRFDETTRLLLPWLAALMWGVAGLSSFRVVTGQFGETVAMLPMAYLSFGLCGMTAVLGVYYLIKTPYDEVDRADIDFGGGRR